MPRTRLPPILAATIATLPDKPPFSAEQREAFFAMLHCAIDVAYGTVAATRSAEDVISASPSLFADAPVVTWQQPSRYTIDHDGFAMYDGNPVKFTDVPPGTVFHDLRTIGLGDTATILWRDGGVRLDGAMPPGVTLHF